jgi:quercetin dioxygenase-like cupin family protein
VSIGADLRATVASHYATRVPSAALQVGPIEGSALALEALSLDPGSERAFDDAVRDSLLYVSSGSGALALDGTEHPLEARSAALVLAGERATLAAGEGDLSLVVATVGVEADRHAPMGRREITVSLDDGSAEQATGARAFQILFGPHNGSTRATLFAGFIPPGKAPWHFHLYDEIVWVPEGPGRLHIGDDNEELGPGAAFRLRPRQVHIVENTSTDDELTILGVFTPAGSPSAAYLTPAVAAEYRFAG